MTQFKVGDRVRYTGNQEMLTPNLLGKTATVTAVASDGYVNGMKWDDPNEDHKSCFAGNLELIEQDKGDANKIDWSGELEAHHEDGRVVPVTFVEDDGSDLPMNISPAMHDSAGLAEWFYRDGGRDSGGWRIRNRKPTTNGRLARLEAFVARVAEGGQMLALGYYEEAKALVAEIATVDPDVSVAKEMAFDAQDDFVTPLASARLEWLERHILSAIKRGRALERGEP